MAWWAENGYGEGTRLMLMEYTLAGESRLVYTHDVTVSRVARRSLWTRWRTPLRFKTGSLLIILGADILSAGLLARLAYIRARLDEGVQA